MRPWAATRDEELAVGCPAAVTAGLDFASSARDLSVGRDEGRGASGRLFRDASVGRDEGRGASGRLFRRCDGWHRAREGAARGHEGAKLALKPRRVLFVLGLIFL